MLAELVIGMAEQAHRTVGPSAALGVLRAAIDRDLVGEDRRTLILRGLGIALLADDRDAFEGLAARWATSGGEATERRGLSLVARLHALDRTFFMGRLAQAEVARFRSADALFALAAHREREGSRETAEALFAESASVAAASGDPVRASRAERELLRIARSASRDREAVSALEAASARDVLRLAPTALTARGLYARVGVLDRLHALAGDPALRSLASRIAVAHADAHGARLSAIERDRVLQILERAQVQPSVIAAVRDGAVFPEPFRARARAALSGNLLGPTPNDASERRDWLGLVVIGAIARSEPRAASAPLASLARGEPSAIAWTAVQTALGQTVLRSEALACVAAWIDRGLPPPRGYASLAHGLERAGATALAERALEQAAAHCEAGARARLARRIEKRAREAYARGALGEARSLLVKALALE